MRGSAKFRNAPVRRASGSTSRSNCRQVYGTKNPVECKWRFAGVDKPLIIFGCMCTAAARGSPRAKASYRWLNRGCFRSRRTGFTAFTWRGDQDRAPLAWKRPSLHSSRNLRSGHPRNAQAFKGLGKAFHKLVWRRRLSGRARVRLNPHTPTTVLVRGNFARSSRLRVRTCENANGWIAEMQKMSLGVGSIRLRAGATLTDLS
jgi:hypothetical protein